ncbi:hypothetical protein [Loigolactobacillus bifermentans]|nr:hypothetical protein [Loigolactobacillus bifermentans]
MADKNIHTPEDYREKPEQRSFKIPKTGGTHKAPRPTENNGTTKR